MTVPSKDANITISNDGMEQSFRTLSDFSYTDVRTTGVFKSDTT